MQRTVAGPVRMLLIWTAFGVLPVLFLPFSPALAQTGSAPAVAPERAATVVSNVDEVALDLVARDKKGNFVADLKLEDLEIVDGGSPVGIKDLRLAGVSAHPRAVTLLFDDMEPGNARSARDAALEVLKGAPATGLSFAVLRVDGRLHLVQGPTGDREALKKAVNAATLGPAAEYLAEVAAAEKQMTEDTRGGPNQKSAKLLLAQMLASQMMIQDTRYTPSVAGLLAVSQGQQEVPGRKTVVYFSQSLSWNRSDPETLRSIVKEANRSRVSIYSIDAHAVDPQAGAGLAVSGALARSANVSQTGVAPASSPTAPAPTTDTLFSQQMGRFEDSEIIGGKTPLDAICQSTGGSHEYGGDTRRSARNIDGALGPYYEASFTPPSQAGEGRFRQVKVRALRAGVVLEAREGYFVPPRRVVPLPPAFETRLLEALAAPKLPAEMPFRSALLHFGEGGDGLVNSVVLETPLRDVDLRSDPAAKAWSVHLAVVAQVRNKAGAVVERFSQDLPRQGALDEREAARREVLTVRRHFTAPPGDYVLESAVLDVNSGKIAAQRSNFTVAPAGSGPALSDAVVVRRIDPFAGDRDSDQSDPLRCVDGKVVPDLSGHVSKAASPTLTLFFDVYPDRKSPEKPLLMAEVRRGDEMMGIVPLIIRDDSGRTSIPYLAELATADLPAGSYRMTVILKQGSQTASQSVSFALDAQ
ncbi:MAG: VWA domain-containing protein [Bryobacteraceae bacterium]